MTIKTLVILALFAFSTTGVVTTAGAGELDNENSVINEQARRAKDLPGTVVVRVNQKTGEASVLESATALPTDQTGVATVERRAGEFKSISTAAVPHELDKDSATPAWYVSFSYGWTPVYYYYNYVYNYVPCYTYRWSDYVYYWYRWY